MEILYQGFLVITLLFNGQLETRLYSSKEKFKTEEICAQQLLIQMEEAANKTPSGMRFFANGFCEKIQPGSPANG